MKPGLFTFWGKAAGAVTLSGNQTHTIIIAIPGGQKGGRRHHHPHQGNHIFKGNQGHHPTPQKRQTRREGGGLLSLEERNEEMTETRIELTDNQRAKLCKMLHSMYLLGFCDAILDRTTEEKGAKALVAVENKSMKTVDRLIRDLFGGPIL